jgi:hypothetical protein
MTDGRPRATRDNLVSPEAATAGVRKPLSARKQGFPGCIRRVRCGGRGVPSSPPHIWLSDSTRNPLPSDGGGFRNGTLGRRTKLGGSSRLVPCPSHSSTQHGSRAATQ